MRGSFRIGSHHSAANLRPVFSGSRTTADNLEDEMSEERMAPDGAVWICGACGKTSKDRYGDGKSMWDESCMLHAVLVHEASVKRGAGGVSATPFDQQYEARS